MSDAETKPPGSAPSTGLGSVPANPAEYHAFYQRRIRIFLAFTWSFWAIAWVLTTGLAALTTPQDVTHGSNAIRVGIHLLATLGTFAAWIVLRKKELSERALATIDAATLIAQALIVSSLTVTAVPIVRYRPDITFILGLTYVLMGRAAVVPSSKRRTYVLGVVASLPILGATYWLYVLAERAGESIAQHYPGDSGTPLIYTAWAVIFCGLSVAVSGFVSGVIYGLQREVQRAHQLGQYTLERELGSGGMGVVYLGRHALLRRPTAIKLLLPERAGATALARFEREVQVTSRLTHPNTVAIYDYGRTHDGVFYYAMEYLDGIDLETLVETHGPLPAARVRHFLSQVAGALAEAHHTSLIHRDIKPSNLMVCERGLTPDFIKVLDFGLARAIESSGAELSQGGVTHAGQITGTPLYMSPEQIQTPESVDGRSDLYALGAVGYFLLTGKPVFTGATVVEICAHHLCSAPPRASAQAPQPVPPKLEAVLLACLEKDREKRPRDAAELRALLAACDDTPEWTVDHARDFWRKAAKPESKRPSPTPSGALTIALDERTPAP